MAKAGRTILSVSDDEVRVRNPYGEEQWVSLHSLTRPELIAAASIKFAKDTNVRWLYVKNANIVQAIRTGVAPVVTAPSNAGWRNQPMTEKQSWKLKQLGFQPFPEMSRGEAADKISELTDRPSSNDWNIPVEQPVSEMQPEVQPVERLIVEQPISVSSPLPQDIADSLEKFQTQIDLLNSLVAKQSDQIIDQAGRITELQQAKPTIYSITVPSSPEPIKITDRQHMVFGSVLRVLNGKSTVTDKWLNLYLVGPAGTGKTTIAKNAAKALGIPFASISVGPTTPDSRFFGYMDANGNYVSTPFRDCWENGGIFLVDEVDNGHAGILTTLNMSLSDTEIAFPNGMVKRHADMRFVVGANTHGTGPTREFIGRNQLDAAFLDRFVEIEVAYDETMETELSLAEYDHESVRDWLGTVRRYRKNAAKYHVLASFSPRACIDGAILLREGFSLGEVSDMRLNKGLDADTVRKLSER